MRVSIHAPVIGAKVNQDGSISALMVSIHAPVIGAKIFIYSINRSTSVSIHAPVIGAKLKLRQGLKPPKFQSTHL